MTRPNEHYPEDTILASIGFRIALAGLILWAIAIGLYFVLG